MSRDETRATADRLLDAAEKLFGERGVRAATLRDITREAEANVAAVSYHFGSKEGLLQAAISRRMEPLNAERIRLLDAVVAEGGENGPDLRAVLRSFLKPTVALWKVHPAYVRFIGRLHGDPDDYRVESFLRLARFPELIGRLRGAFRAALPTHDPDDLWWSMIFTVGAMIHTWAVGPKMEGFSGGEARLEDEDRMVDRLVTFCAAGMRAKPGNGGDA